MMIIVKIIMIVVIIIMIFPVVGNKNMDRPHGAFTEQEFLNKTWTMNMER